MMGFRDERGGDTRRRRPAWPRTIAVSAAVVGLLASSVGSATAAPAGVDRVKAIVTFDDSLRMP